MKILPLENYPLYGIPGAPGPREDPACACAKQIINGWGSYSDASFVNRSWCFIASSFLSVSSV